jgi:hypothetical protein
MSKPKWILLVQYIGHAILASYGIFLADFMMERLIGEMASPRNLHLDRIFLGPTFLVPIVMGFVLGGFLGKDLPVLSSRLIFILPLSLMAWEIWGFSDPCISKLASIRDNFFGEHCSGSECLDELLLSAPFFSSLAYAIGAEVSRYGSRRFRREHLS